MPSPRLVPDYLQRLSQRPRSFTLPDQRVLSFDEHGDPNGRPCFWFHGSPSCRLEGVLLELFGREHGHRFIAVDRPGIGRSSPSTGWSMGSFAHDIAALATALGFERYSVAGGSGGGPFVLAMAAMFPHHIHRAVSLACAGAFEIDAIRARIGWVDRLAAWAAPAPGLLAVYFGSISLLAHGPENVARLMTKPFARWLPNGDPRLVTVFQRTLREATFQGTAGVVEDTRVLHRPWGFDVADIRVSVDYVNGTLDEFVPFAYGAALAERTPNSRLHRVEGADHFETIFDVNGLQALLH